MSHSRTLRFLEFKRTFTWPLKVTFMDVADAGFLAAGAKISLILQQIERSRLSLKSVRDERSGFKLSGWRPGPAPLGRVPCHLHLTNYWKLCRKAALASR